MYPLRREEGMLGLNLCPRCRGKLVSDVEKGEVSCQACGFVAVDQAIDPSAEWKSSDFEDGASRTRTGLPRTLTLHDYGLSTDISGDGKDSHGRYLDQISRLNAQRMQKWQKRIRMYSSSERTLSIGLSKISEAGDNLNLPGSVVEEASRIFRKSAKQSISKSKSIAGMATACLYLACRRIEVNRTIKEIAKAANIQSRAAAKYYRLLYGIENRYIPPPTVQKYISKLVNKEKINPRVERLALELADKTNESEISSGKTPAGLAAAYVYIAAVMYGEHIPQREIAEFAEVTEVTVRNRCREILENFVIRQKLKAMVV